MALAPNAATKGFAVSAIHAAVTAGNRRCQNTGAASGSSAIESSMPAKGSALHAGSSSPRSPAALSAARGPARAAPSTTTTRRQAPPRWRRGRAAPGRTRGAGRPTWRPRRRSASPLSPPEERLPEVRPVGPPLVALPVLAQQRLDAPALLRRRCELERVPEVRAPLLDDAQTEVQLAQRAARAERVGIERYRALEVVERAVDLPRARVGHAEHGVHGDRPAAARHDPLEDFDRLPQMPALEVALGDLERAPGVTDQRRRLVRHHRVAFTGRRGSSPA